MTVEVNLNELIQGFFLEWLEKERKVSVNTILSYRDSFALYFKWLRDVRGVDPIDISMDNLTANDINAFLSWLEDARGCIPKTLNCRLAAFWSFARFAARKAPQHIAQFSSISSIPKRNGRRKEIDYLTPDEVDWMIECCKPGSETELMVALLYNTGARISELISARAEDVRTFSDSRCHIHFFGKGRKDRTVPLWQDTSELLVSHMNRNALKGDDYLFVGRNVDHLTRSGARNRLEVVAKTAKKAHPELRRKKITPHVYRHSTAMAMIAAGVDIATVAIWLGHEDINTTHKYVVSDMRVKEAALEKASHKWDVSPRKPYKASKDVIDFLNSL